MHACVRQLHTGDSFKLVLQNGTRKTLPGGPALLPRLCHLCLVKPNKCELPAHPDTPQVHKSVHLKNGSGYCVPDTGLNVSPSFCHVVQAGGVDGEL